MESQCDFLILRRNLWLKIRYGEPHIGEFERTRGKVNVLGLTELTDVKRNLQWLIEAVSWPSSVHFDLEGNDW